MSFWREPFNQIVKKQLQRRAEIHLEGRTFDSAHGKGSKTRSNDWYQFMVSRTAFLRISPTVIIKDKETLKADTPLNFAQHFVLEGVPLIPTSDGTDTGRKFIRAPQFPSNPSGKGNKNNLLNNPTIRTSPDKDGFGIVPPPGVISFSTQTKSFYGNVRAAKVSIRCFSLQQLNIIEKLYSRPGHHMFIEWGWDKYSDYNISTQNKKSTIKQVGMLISDLNYGRSSTFDFWGESIDAGSLQSEIAFLRKEYQGNYDGLIGIVDSFTTKVEKDGGYTVDVSLISRSELINSLKLNTKGKSILWDGNNSTNQTKFKTLGTNFKPGEAGTTLEYTQLPEKTNASGEVVNTLEDTSQSIREPTLSILRQYIRATTFNAINTSCGGIKDEDSEGDLERASESGWIMAALIGVGAAILILSNPVGWVVGLVALVGTFAAGVAIAGAVTLGVYFSGLGGFLSPDWSDGLSSEMVRAISTDVEFGHIFRPYVDWILMADAKLSNSLEWGPLSGVVDTEGDETHSEIGLGPYIRLGTLLRFINHQVIPQNKKGQPLVYCTNESYNDSFEPQVSSFTEESPYAMYPNCYSVHPLEWTFPMIFRLIEGEVLGHEVTIQQSEGILSDEFWNNYLDGKQTSVILTPSRTLDTESEEAQATAAAQEGHSMYYYGISKNEFLELFKYCYNVRSATPSKVMFPHEFRKVPNEFGGSYQQIQHSYLTSEENNKEGEETGLPLLFEHWWDFLSNLPISIKGFDKGQIPLNYIHNDALIDNTHGSEHWDGSGKNGDVKDLLASISFRDNLRYLVYNKTITAAYFNDVLKHVEEIGWKAFLQKLHDKNLGYDRVRNIDNIMINLFHLDKFLEDSPDVTLNDFLKEICEICNTAMGDAIELKVVSNPMYNEAIAIQDMRVSAYKGAKIKDQYFSFPTIGYGSLYKNLGITGKVPSAMAASIAIAAQDPKDATTIEQITYKNFLTDIEDRIIRNLNVKSEEELTEEADDAIIQYNELVKGFLRDTLYMREFYTKGLHKDAPHIEKPWFSEAEKEAPNALRMALEASNKIFSQVVANNSNGEKRVFTFATALPYGSIIPLEVSLSLEGVSGIFTANVFKMQRGTLPIQYNTDNVVFLVNGVKESVSGLTWTTDIKAQLIIINDRVAPQSSILDSAGLPASGFPPVVTRPLRPDERHLLA